MPWVLLLLLLPRCVMNAVALSTFDRVARTSDFAQFHGKYYRRRGCCG